MTTDMSAAMAAVQRPDENRPESGEQYLEALRAEVHAERAGEAAAEANWVSEQAHRAAQYGGPDAPTAPSADEVAAEAPYEYPVDATAVQLGQHGLVHILAADDWTSSAQGCLRGGDFDGWAEQCLAGPDFDKVWCEANDGRGPKLRDINQMFDDWALATGQHPGKSRGSGASSARFRRR